MSAWADGYITDLEYTSGYFRELAPSHLGFAAMLKRQWAPDAGQPLNYCELGCGHGVTLNVLAAANPHIQFHANDFNPSHVVGALRLAQDAGLPNAHFYDDSFEVFADQPNLPAQFDIIALHGIYTWISAENRAHIREFIRRKLKPGGLVYISYNVLPGWSAVAPLRHLLKLHAAETGGALPSRLKSGLDFIDELQAANGRFTQTPTVKAHLDRMRTADPAYVTHEYLNTYWTLFYHSELVGELAEAKLSFIGSANVTDHVDAFNFTGEQEKLLAKTADPVMRETLRDYITNQTFRRDVFVKGPQAHPGAVTQALWREQRFALIMERDAVELKVSGARGKLDLNAASINPVLDALAQGPQTAAALMENHPSVAAHGLERLKLSLIALVGNGAVAPCLPQQGDSERAGQARAFNIAVLRRAHLSNGQPILASPVTGGGLGLDRTMQLFLLARMEGRKDVTQFALEALFSGPRRLLKDGKVLASKEDTLAELETRHAKFLADTLPMLERLQVV